MQKQIFSLFLIVTSIHQTYAVATSFEVAVGETNLLELQEGGNVVVNLVYESSDTATYNFAASLDTGTSLSTTEAQTNSTQKTIAYTINSADVTDGWGTYLLNFTLDDGASEVDVYKEVVLFYEEAISGFQISRTNAFLPLEEQTSFTATFSGGSNLETEWFLDTNDTCLLQHTGNGSRNHVLNFNFTVGGTHNVTVVAANTVSRTYDSMIVEAIYRVNGLNVTISNTVVATSENISVTITASSAANFSQGQLKVNISYGDGSSDQTVDLSDVTHLQGAGYQVQHPYTSQGNYTVILLFYNELGSSEISKEVFIWDQLFVTLNSAFACITGQPLSFDFISPSKSNFHFSISYGDGNVYEVTDVNLTQSYSHMPWNYTYANSGTYNVTMTAWNPIYVSVCSYQVTCQVPLLPDNTTLSPTLDEIPYPDGIVNFTLVLTADVPSPDAVLCTFDYGDSKVDGNISTIFNYNVAVIKRHTYTNAGAFMFTVNCSNLISTMQKTATILVQNFTMNDFELHVENPVPMNMTREDTHSTIDYRHPVKPKTIPRNVTFALKLFNCSRMPSDITATWNFGDGINLSPELQSTFGKQHTYNLRENLTVSVKLENNKNDQTTITKNLVLGITTLNSDKQAAPIGTGVFTLTASSILGTPSFAFHSDSDDTVSCPGGNCTVSYSKYGTYLPSVTATYGSFTEIVYLSEPLAVDYNLTGNLEIEFSNTTVDLPPGNVTINITSSNMSFPFVRCSLLSGDLIDSSLHEKIQNITPTEPMIFPYTYQTLGKHNLSANCSNYLTTIPISNIVQAKNPCFTENGIFDRQYSHISNPMKVYTSQDVYISSRMGIICDKKPDFGWEIFSNYNSEEDKIKFNYTNLFSPSKGQMLFPRGKIPEGKYLLTLNVSLDGTWIKEPIVVQFIKPAPYAYIIGGSKRMARKVDTVIELNALDESYDAEGGFGDNKQLHFSWKCKTVNTSDLNEIEIIVNSNFNVSTYAIGNCTLNETQVSGKERLNITTSPGYIVTVNVSDGKKSSEYSQMLSILEGNPPVVKLECIINCKEKLAVTSRMTVLAKCLDCNETEKPSYEWSLKAFDGGNWSTIDLESKTANGINSQALVLKENTLDPGEKYTITLNTTVDSRSKPSTVFMDLVTNYPPYNGTCSVTPTEGMALKDTFSIECSGWIDEGTNRERNLTRDKRNGEPLTYLYETITRRNLSTGIQDVKTELFLGGESTVTDVPLQLGDPAFDYKVTVKVHIYDRIGDKAIFKKNITVRPMEKVTPNSSSDTGAIDLLFESFNKEFKRTDAGGNDMGVVRLVSSVSSYIVDFSEGDSPGTTEEDILSGRTSKITTPTTSKVTRLYQEKTTEMTNILLKTVESDSGTKKQFSATDVQQISSALESVTRSPAYITTESANASTSVTKVMMESVFRTSQTKPFPVESLESMKSALFSTIKVLNNILTSMLPTTVVDITSRITLDSIIAELTTKQKRTQSHADHSGTTQSPMTTEEIRTKAKLLYDIRIEKQEKQKQQAAFAENNIAKIEDALKDMKKIQLLQQEVGEGASLLSQDGLDVSTEKVTFERIMNRTEQYIKGIQLDFEAERNNTNRDEQTILDIQVVVHDKNPYIFGQSYEASAVTSNVTSVVVSGDIRPDVKFINKNIKQYQDHSPKMDPKDPKKIIYIKFEMKNEGDAVIVYIRPHGMVLDDRSTHIFYNVYLGDVTFLSSSSFDFFETLSISDWTPNYGFKTFLKQGCRKGSCYIGIEQMEMKDYSSSAVRNGRKRQASVTNPSPLNSTLEFTVANFSYIIVTTGCRLWDAKGKSWDSDGCKVLPMSNINETICRCPDPSKGSIFASTFYVPSNEIDFNTVWNKIDLSNAAVYGTVIVLLVVYAISAILLRREDKKDIERWAIHFLVDSDSSDDYFYIITVHTGLWRGAGTKSVVNFVVVGEENNSGVRILSDGVKEGFDTGSVKKFIMGTKEQLGELTYLRIWHDNSGSGNYKNWYLNKIVVDDPQTNTRYVFLCNRWLALDQDDGQVHRVVPVCGLDNLLAFNTLFAQHAVFNLTENHLWLSLMIRPERSSFTRVQRLSCVLALLFLTMIANAMFFKSSSEEQNSNEVQIGFLRFSMSSVYVSMIGIVLTTPPIIFVTMVFKKCKPKVEIKHKHVKKDQELDKKVKENMYIELKKRCFNGEDLFTNDNLPLPHWMVYAAWVVVWLAVIISAFFLFLYSMEWGKSKAEEWLSSFFLSFVQSLICVDTLKVIIIAVLLAMLVKQPADGETPKMDLNKLKATASQYNSGSESSYMDFVNGIFNKSEPPLQSDMENLRQRNNQELKAQEALLNLIFYTIFLFVIYSISYIQRDHRAFFMKSNVDNYLVRHGNGQLGFSGINKTADLFSWLNQTFIPTFYPENRYSGASLGVQDKKYFGDLASIRVGPGRLRQVRMNKGECDYYKLSWPRYCVSHYNIYQEDESEYCHGWNPFNATACDTTEYKRRFETSAAWRFTKSIDIWGLPLTGKYNTYGGGGYILNLPKSRIKAQLFLKELQDFNWIDRGTRAILLEFTLYNPNANLFTYVTYIAEITEIGCSFTWTDTTPFRPIVSLNAMGTFAIICYCVYVLYQLIVTFNTLKGIRRDGLCEYYKVVWNVVDTVCLILGYSAIAIFILRLSYTNHAMGLYYDELSKEEMDFINFFHIVVWDRLFNILMSILVFIGILRILRILGYNQKLMEVITVVTNAAKEIIGFGVVFGMVFGGYVILGYLIFGRTLYEYRSIFTSWGTLTNALIGKNSLDTMIHAAPHLAQVYYFTYVFCVLFTLITMFAAILNKSITKVRNDSTKQEDMFGIIDMLTKSFKNIIGIAYKTDRSLSKNAEAKQKYMQSIGIKATFDAPNILRLVRTALDEVSSGEQQRMETSRPRSLLLNKVHPISRSRSFSKTSRTGTLRNVNLASSDAGVNLKLQSFL